MVNREKIEYITQLSECKSNRECMLLSKILDILIDETRVHNDSCDPVELRFNQGKISAFWELKRYIQSGILPEGMR